MIKMVDMLRVTMSTTKMITIMALIIANTKMTMIMTMVMILITMIMMIMTVTMIMSITGRLNKSKVNLILDCSPTITNHLMFLMTSAMIMGTRVHQVIIFIKRRIKKREIEPEEKANLYHQIKRLFQRDL